jgi:SnoaL-like domain
MLSLVPLSADDRLDIQQLVARYNFALDSGNGEEFASCFVADGRFDYTADLRVEGQEKLREFPAMVAGLGLIRHMVSSFLIDGDGDQATSRCYCQVFGINRNGSAYVVSQGAYEDRVIRTDAGWRFRERRYIADPVSPPQSSREG